MILKQLRQEIKNKSKVENNIQSLENEKATLQRQCSILLQKIEELSKDLDKLEHNKLSFLFPNNELKYLEKQENLRITKSKYNALQYQYDLIIKDLNKQKDVLNKMNNYEIEYENELNYQISQLSHPMKEQYIQIINENIQYKMIIQEAEKMMDCLKKMDLYCTRGENYSPNDKRYTLGNTIWIMGSPSVDIYNLKKEIDSFEEPLKEIKNEDLHKDIQIYFKYSQDFFESTVKLLGFDLFKNESYAMKVVDFKRDISNITNKVKIIYQDNLTKELKIKRQLEEYLLK